MAYLFLMVHTIVFSFNIPDIGPYYKEEPRKAAIEDLKALLHAENEWIKVHVGEYLLWQGLLVDEVRKAFLEEQHSFGDTPKYRIGIWRVLVQVAQNEEERAGWLSRIVTAYEDVDGSDRLHAIETLAKLGYPVVTATDAVSLMRSSTLDGFGLYSLWNALHQPGADAGTITEFLVSRIEEQGKIGDLGTLPVLSFIIRKLRPLAAEYGLRIRDSALAFDGAVGTQASLLATAWITFPRDSDGTWISSVRSKLLALRNEPDALMSLIFALAESENVADMSILQTIFEQSRDVNRPSYDADIHATAAYAILKARVFHEK